MVRGAWGATVHGLAKSQTRLKRLSMDADNPAVSPFFFPYQKLFGNEEKGNHQCMYVCLGRRGGHGVVVEGLWEWKPKQMPALRTEARFPGDLSLWVQ